MQKHVSVIGATIVVVGVCLAGDFRTFTVTMNSTNAALAITNFADSFAGEIDEIAVYTPSGVTGAVAIAAIDSYSGGALVLATNAAVTGYEGWRPRIDAPAVGGVTAFAVTNKTATSEPFRAQGESVRAIISAASKTSAVFRVFLKIR